MMQVPARDMRMTPQRMAVIAYLEGNTTHPSAMDVFEFVSRKFPTMSFATVYSTLQTLKDKGRLLELTLDPHKKRFDPNVAPHHHLICVVCKKIVDVMRTFDLSLSDEERCGFRLIGNHADFYGVCPTCGKNGEGTGWVEKHEGF